MCLVAFANVVFASLGCSFKIICVANLSYFSSCSKQFSHIFHRNIWENIYSILIWRKYTVYSYGESLAFYQIFIHFFFRLHGQVSINDGDKLTLFTHQDMLIQLFAALFQLSPETVFFFSSAHGHTNLTFLEHMLIMLMHMELWNF